MRNYHLYSAEELAADRTFQAWVRGSDPLASAFWDSWIHNHPEAVPVINKARDIVRQLQFKEYPYSNEMEEVKGHLQQALRNARGSLRHAHSSGSKARLLKLYRPAAAAAIVLFLAGSWWMLQRTAHRPAAMAPVAKAATGITRPVSQPLSWHRRRNNSGKAEKIRLEDSSVITLFRNAVVEYPEPFAGDKREIRLQGDAVFEVAKDARRQFTVYARMLAVTVLGTSFRVTAAEGQKGSVTVRLFTGKVQVRPARKLDNWKDGKPVFLLPGEQLEYNSSGKIVSNFRSAGPRPSGTCFNNTPLPVVIRTLSSLYQTKIDYDSSDIAAISFTGTIDKSDNLGSVLQAIARMNGLSVTPTQAGFSVTRPGK